MESIKTNKTISLTTAFNKGVFKKELPLTQDLKLIVSALFLNIFIQFNTKTNRYSPF